MTSVPQQYELLPDQPSTWDSIRRFGPPAVLALVAFLFVVQNTRATEFNFLWFHFRWPLWIMLAVALLIGAAVAVLVGWRVKARRTKREELAARAAARADASE